jgi:outer membrane receptor protein involved in Fe transport
VGELLDDGQFVGKTWHVDPESGELESGNPSLRYNFNEPAWVTPEVERFNMMATFRHEFGESMEFFADAFYYESESLTQRAASPIDEGLAYLIMPADSYYNPFDEDALIVRWRPVDLGPRIIQADGETWSITAGLRGDWSNWSWEAGLVFSEAKATDIEQNRQSKTLFTQQLAVDGPDALNPLALPGENTQAALDGIRVATTDVRKSELTLADFRLNRGDLFQTFGNDTGIALGVEWREETYKDDRDPRLDGTITYTTGPVFDESDVIGMSATPDSGASRDTYSAYGELYMPLIGAANEKSWTRGLELQLAVRYENPSDFDDKWAPKIGFRWEIVEGLSIRGSYTEGFKAPNLPQMNQGDIVRRLQDIEDPMRADVTDAPIDTGDTYRITSRLSNPNLDPEESETTLIGFVFTPTWAANEWWSGLRIGADWWNIKQTGLVGIIDEDDQLAIDQALRESGAGFNPNVVRAEITPEDQALFDEYNAANPDDQRIPVGVVTNIISQYENLQPREVEGWDATFVYATPETAAGQFTLRADYTRITKFDQEGLVPVDRLRRNGNPENRYTVSLDWRFRNFFANVNARYVDEAYDTSLSCNSSAACQDPGEPGTVVDGTKYWTVEDWTVYNLTLGYDFAGMGNWSNGLILNGGIRNLTNEEPPFADESYGYLTRLHNTYGRVYWFRIGYQF